MKKIYLYFHYDFDGVISCVLAFHLFKGLGFRPVVAEAIAHEELPEKRLKKPFAILDSVYRKDAYAYFDHHSMNRPKKISKETKFYAFDDKAKCCAEVIYAYAKKNKIKLLSDRALKKLLYWARVLDAALYPDYGIKAIETIKPTIPAIKINISLEEQDKVLTKRAVKELIKSPSLEKVAKFKGVKRKLNRLLPLKEQALKAFKRYSYYDPKTGLVTYDATPFQWNRHAYAALYPKSQMAVGLAKIKKSYFIKASKNPWNKKLSAKIKKLDIGNILKKVGGGGHRVAGAARFSSYKEAEAALQRVISEIAKLMAN